MTPPTRVLVADDHPPLREAVRRALEDAGFEVCADVADAPSAIEAAVRERPDVCLLDIQMPGGGLAAAADIAARVPQTAVVMLTVSRDDADLLEALRAGAAGYLLKTMDRRRLPEALRTVLAGESVLPRTLVGRVVERLQQGERVRPFTRQRGVELTAREWEVLNLLREGLSTAEIATRLFVTPVTVRSHVAAIVRKLDVDDRESAIRLLDDR